jgi:uncharacterized protein with PIN domain
MKCDNKEPHPSHVWQDEIYHECPGVNVQILDSTDELLESRKAVYGDRIKNMERTAQLWSALLGVEILDWQVPLMMSAYKMFRTFETPNYSDNSDDIFGWGKMFQEVMEANHGGIIQARTVEEYKAELDRRAPTKAGWEARTMERAKEERIAELEQQVADLSRGRAETHMGRGDEHKTRDDLCDTCGTNWHAAHKANCPVAVEFKLLQWKCGKCDQEAMGRPLDQQLPGHTAHCWYRNYCMNSRACTVETDQHVESCPQKPF